MAEIAIAIEIATMDVPENARVPDVTITTEIVTEIATQMEIAQEIIVAEIVPEITIMTEIATEIAITSEVLNIRDIKVSRIRSSTAFTNPGNKKRRERKPRRLPPQMLNRRLTTNLKNGGWWPTPFSLADPLMVAHA